MIITIILVLVGFVSLAALLFLARGQAKPPANLADLGNQTQALDIEAFRNLTDYAEEEFLRTTLEPAQFRVIQRARLRAAVEYIGCASRNAAILQSFGEAARHSPSRSVAEAGDRLVNSAIRFRLNAVHCVVRIHLAILIPGTRVRKLSITEGYEKMTTLVALLGCLQFERRGPFSSRLPQLMG